MKPKIMEIIAEVAKLTGYTSEEIRGPSRTQHLAAVRQYAMWRAYRECGRSLPEVGLVFRRDHTTVLYAFRKVEAMSPLERGVFGPRPRRIRPSHRAGEGITYMGEPCANAHNGQRYRESGKCVHCTRSRAAARRFMQRAQNEAIRNHYKIAAE